MFNEGFKEYFNTIFLTFNNNFLISKWAKIKAKQSGEVNNDLLDFSIIKHNEWD